MPQIRS